MKQQQANVVQYSKEEAALLKQMHLLAHVPEPLSLCHSLMDFGDKTQVLHFNC